MEIEQLKAGDNWYGMILKKDWADLDEKTQAYVREWGRMNQVKPLGKVIDGVRRYDSNICCHVCGELAVEETWRTDKPHCIEHGDSV